MMRRVQNLLPRLFSISLVLLGFLLFPSASFSQEFFPRNGVMPTGWVTPGFANAGWSVATDSVSQGTYSLKSNPIGNGQTAAVDVTINVASPGTVSFNYRVSSEATWDFLQFYVNGILQNQWSGESGWATANFALPAGTHTLSWRYFKDAICCTSGSDAAWIDNVRLPGVPNVAAGFYHSLALKSDGTVWGAGYNGYGQLGNGTLTDATVSPVQVSGLANVVAVSAASYYSLALKSDGTVVGWGDNGSGRITGVAGGTFSTPTAAGAGVTGVVAIAAGGFHALALTNTGTVVAWGNTTYTAGINGLTGVVAISAGYQHSLALKGDGTVVAAGVDNYGVVFGAASVTGAVAISAGIFHNLVLMSDGTVLAWGDNSNGQITGIAGGSYATPTAAGGGVTGVVGIAAGYLHSLALRPDGTVAAWGSNGYTQVTGAAGASSGVALASGLHHGLIAGSSGTVFGWGDNFYGQRTAIAGVNLDATAPAVPTGLAANAVSASQINLTWNAALDIITPANSLYYAGVSSGLTAYQVFRGGVFVTTVSAPTLSYNDTGLTNGTTYNYTVKACDVAGNCSAASGAASATTPDTAAPTVPGGLAAVAVSQSQINVSWNATTDNVAVTIYHVFRGGVQIATVNSPTLSYSDTGLAASTTYTYRVDACDAAGNCSTQSASSSTATPDTQAPTVPTGLTATAVSGTQIDLAWTAATDNVAVAAYGVYRGGVFRTTVATNSFSDTGLTNATNYSYTVLACDAAGNCSAQSTSSNATTFDTQAPNAPTGLTATAASQSQINLSWTAPSDNVAVTAYGVFRAGVFRTTVATNSFNDTGLAASTNYSYTVLACDAANNCSAQSTSANATTPDTQAPTVPAGLTPTAVSGSQINLAWTSSTDNVAVTIYHVFRGGVQIATVNSPTLSYSDTGLTNATNYSYTVLACDAAGNCSAQSASANATTFDTQAPNVPTGLTATAFSGSQINLAWGASTDNVAVAAYRVSRGGVFLATVNAPTVTYSSTGLTDATTYSYTVAACDAAANCSADSASASAITLDTTAPTVPGGFTATASSQSTIDLAWTASTDNVAVTVYRVSQGGVPRATVNHPTTSFGDTGLSQTTLYSYTVTACDTAGNCSAAASASATTLAANPPTTVTATVPAGVTGETQIDLNWTSTIVSFPGTIGYQVFRNGVFRDTVNEPTVSYSDTGLSPATTYSYRVVAFDVIPNYSTPSVAASATTRDVTAPSVPTGLVAVAAGPSQINLTWNASTDNVAVTAYRVFRGGVFRATVNAPTVTYSETGLMNATTYSYTVAACDAAGNCSAQSASASATTPDNVAPSVPAGITAAIAAGAFHSLALQTDGTVVAWGDNAFGQSTVPGGLTGVESIAAGAYHSLALKSDGTVVAWGRNDDGQTTVPGGLTNAAAVAAGANFSLALTTNGTVVAWGSNISGQSTVPAGLADVVAIAANGEYALALKSDGTVVAWGSNASGETTVPGGLASVTGIAAGTSHALALKSDGTVVAWGDNSFGQSTVPGGLASVTLVAAGGFHSLALKSDGTVVAWGSNASGQSAVPGGLTGVVAIAGGGAHSLALKSDGTVVAWGLNTSGQTTVPGAFTLATTLTATAVSQSQINLAWNASTDNVGVTLYLVFRGGVQIATVNSPTLSYSDTGLVVATYTYTVNACDAAGNCSTQSVSASTTTPDQTAPNVPTGLGAAAASQSQIDISWTAPTDNVAVTAYGVYRGGVFLTTVNAPTLTLNDTGLAASTTYTYTVNACDAANNCSAQSASTSATTPDTEAPSVPAGLTATAVAQDQIDLAWTASTDNVGVAIYRVFRAGVQVGTVSSPTLSFSDTGLAAATTYLYRVGACDAAGNCSALSASASATTPDTQPPTVPTGLTATAISASQINIAWTAATDNVAVASYQISRGGVLIQVVGGATLSYSDTGLTNGTTYTYTVAACDAANNCSAQSSTASATTPDTQAPTVPTGFTAAGASQSIINLSWTASTDNVGVAGYSVSRGGVFLTTVNAPTASFSDTGLTTATTYSYTVAACDAAANCSATTATSATTHSVFTPNLALAWNLVGNSLDIALDVATIFGTSNPASPIDSIWTWDTTLDKWKFYSPKLTIAENTAYAAANNHVLLSTINAGEGYWVNATAPVVLSTQNGPAYSYNAVTFAALTPGGTANLSWNLISTSDALTPSEFNNQVSSPTPAPGVVPTNNFVSLWTWDAAANKWYFYSPLLEASGGLAAVKNYADTYGYLHFQDTGKLLGIGTSFWVNRP